jgi:hypothetical protein
MCCSTARLSCHAPSLAKACSSVLKEMSVGLQRGVGAAAAAAGGEHMCTRIDTIAMHTALQRGKHTAQRCKAHTRMHTRAHRQHT